MSWLLPLLGGEPGPAATELMEMSGSLLVGRRTFGGDDPHGGDPAREGPFGGAWHGQQIVLTHRIPDVDWPDVTFMDDFEAALDAAAAAAGDRCVNVLGADVARQCLQAGRLDELFLFVAPVLLGDGTRLFDHPGGTNVRLEPFSSCTEGQATVLRYGVAR